jgi:8-oxo-dGTP diphosphatase
MKIPKYCPLCKTKLSIRNIDGFRRRQCPGCGWVYYANPLPSAVAFVCTEDNKILLVKRGVAPGKGKWALPSGFVEENELPEDTVIRELKEEANLRGTVTNLIGVYAEPTRIYGNVLLIAYNISCANTSPRAGTDSLAAKFFSAKKTPPITFASHRAIIKDGLARRTSRDVQIHMLKSKITKATITHTHLFYKGSMGIDGAVMKAVGLFPGEKVHVLNYDNGERLETYTIEEKPGSGRIVLYGPASKKGSVGQKLCILSYAIMNYADAKNYKPRVITLDSNNKIRR